MNEANLMTNITSPGPFIFGILLLLLLTQDRGFAADRMLDCRSTFLPNSSHEEIRKQFSNLNVESTALHEGEGFYEQGTVIFGGSGVGPVEIFWKDVQQQQYPKIVRIRGEQKSWRTDNGLTLGQTLHEVEQLNGQAFVLQGFGYDHGGTQTSWSGGHLESPPSSACQTHVRFSLNRPPDSQKEFDILGEQDFSSANQTLQELNPQISEIWLSYGE